MHTDRQRCVALWKKVMIRKLVDRILITILMWLRDKEENDGRNWKEILGEINEHIENHTIFLKPTSGPQIKYDPGLSLELYPEIDGISVVYYQKNIEVSDTKAPSLRMKSKLEKILDAELVILLNREPESFSGYYVYIK